MQMGGDATGAEGTSGVEKLRLEVASGSAAGTVIEVEDELVIGRQAAGAGTLGNDIEISRQHARIASDADGRYLIEDLGSTNGTYVNGSAIDSPVMLETGDRIEMGTSAVIVHGAPPPPTPETMVEPEPAGSPPPGASATPETLVERTEGGVDVAVEPAGLPRLSLRIDVDLEAREITVALAEADAGEARFFEEDGRWRLK